MRKKIFKTPNSSKRKPIHRPPQPPQQPPHKKTKATIPPIQIDSDNGVSPHSTSVGSAFLTGITDSQQSFAMENFVVTFTVDSGKEPKSQPEFKSAGGFTSAKSMLNKPKPAAAPKSIDLTEDEDKSAAPIRLDSCQSRISRMPIDKPLLIVAGAGTGKTTTLCARILEIINQGVRPAHILAISFTNKAANELRERIEAMLVAANARGTATTGGKLEMPFVGTFHSWCYQLLLRFYRNIGLARCPGILAMKSECISVIKHSIALVEDSRMLSMCEKMLGIARKTAGAGDERIVAPDADCRWRVVVDTAARDTGFSVAAAMTDIDAAREQATKKKARKKSELSQGLKTDEKEMEVRRALYLHLFSRNRDRSNAANICDHPFEYRNIASDHMKDINEPLVNFVHNAKAHGLKSERYPTQERAILDAYQCVLNKYNLADFDDLLTYANAILDVPTVREKMRAAFPYMLVDEFQDLNRLQMDLVLRMQKGAGKVTAVGDERQSIYAFRGAECESNFKTFLENFVDVSVAASSGIEGTLESLTTNYRSHRSIVDLGNVIARQTAGQNKLLTRLRTPLAALPDIPVIPISVWECTSNVDEGERIASKIEQLQKASDCKLSDIAILSRCLRMGACSFTDKIQKSLIKKGIPFVVRGGVSVLRTKQIQSLLAALRVLVDRTDDIAMEQCMAELVHKVGPASIQKIMEFGSGMPLFTACERVIKTTTITKPARDNLGYFVNTINDIAAGMATLRLRGVVECIFDKLIDVYVTKNEKSLENLSEEDKEVASETKDLVLDLVESFVSQPEVRPPRDGDESFDPENVVDASGACTGEIILAFSAYAAMMTGSAEDKGKLTRPKGKSGNDAVFISTVHQSKGLEWKHVFLVHFNDGLFPLRARDQGPAIKSAKGLEQLSRNQAEAQHYREEGRLAYVAITRAKCGLYISMLKSYPVSWMQKYFGPEKPSRYLPEIMHPRSMAMESTQYTSSDDGFL